MSEFFFITIVLIPTLLGFMLCNPDYVQYFDVLIFSRIGL